MTVLRVTPRAGRFGPAAVPAVLLCLALSVLAAGCSKSPEKTVVATVGPRQVTQAYYESKLAKLKESELPHDAQNRPLDTGSREGRMAFLDVIINKELMALKADELGLGADQQIASAAQAIREYNAPTIMHADLIEKPSSQITDAEIQDYYKNLQTKRKCSFIICNFRDDAEKARADIVSGKPWEDVADQYNDGSRGPANNYTMEVQWGRLEDTFERAIWELKEGEISQPIQTVYGYWIVRADAIEQVRVPPLDDAYRKRVVDSIRARKINLARRVFVDESRRKHEFKLDENSLWIVYQGLPEGEVMLDPVTQKPVPREKLQPLKAQTDDLDKFLYQVKLDGKLTTWTVGDYKQLFDKMNVFERPKRTDMLGGLRNNLMGVVDRQLMLQEARERGYMDDPRVTGDTQEKREQMMVTRLHEQVVKVDEHVTPEDLQAFYQAHAADFDVPETRFGKVVICASQQAAEQARAAAQSGKPWDEILTRYSSDQTNKQNRGHIGPVARNATSPLAAPMFALTSRGELSPPVRLDQAWAVVRFDSTAAPRRLAVDEISAEVGTRIKNQRLEEKLQQLLAEWRQQFPVKIHEKQLAACRSWAQLAALPPSENPLTKPQVR